MQFDRNLFTIIAQYMAPTHAGVLFLIDKATLSAVSNILLFRYNTNTRELNSVKYSTLSYHDYNGHISSATHSLDAYKCTVSNSSLIANVVDLNACQLPYLEYMDAYIVGLYDVIIDKPLTINCDNLTIVRSSGVIKTNGYVDIGDLTGSQLSIETQRDVTADTLDKTTRVSIIANSLTCDEISGDYTGIIDCKELTITHSVCCDFTRETFPSLERLYLAQKAKIVDAVFDIRVTITTI